MEHVVQALRVRSWRPRAWPVVSRVPCRRCRLACERSGRWSGSRCGVARKRRAITLHQECPPWHPHDRHPGGGTRHVRDRIDPHKGSHTAAVLDDTERLVGELRVNADRWQRDRLLRFAAPFEPRSQIAGRVTFAMSISPESTRAQFGSVASDWSRSEGVVWTSDRSRGMRRDPTG